MKKKLSMLLAVCALMTAFSMPASALEYEFDAPSAGLFGRPTSDETIYVGVGDSVNIDRGKSAALIPPTFGSPASYTLNAGEYLTPNLLSGQNGSVSTGGVTVVPPSVGGMTGTDSSTNGSYWTPTYTAVTEDLYYAAGHLGTLKIPAISLTVKVYQGTDSAALAKGAGHFSSTSIWDGNVAFAAHNRGVANHFGKIHTLSIGDKITYTTKLGTRTYEVYSVSKISVNDVSVLNDSADNILKNAFSSGPLGELPTPTCDWSKLPQPELPEAEARHFTIGGLDYLFQRNLYETRRMLYTLYNAIGDNPETWQNGEPVMFPSGNDKVKISLTIPAEVTPQSFWPWRAEQLTELFNSCPPGTYSMEAWDVYKDGVFQYTEYSIYVS